jgi:hypothetical protein
MILQVLAWFYLISIGIFVLFLPIAYYMENKVSDDKPIKKWWRKHIVGLDEEEHF